MSKYTQREARNAYGLNNPQVGDAWNERFKWHLLVVAIKPKTPLFPEMIVCCTKAVTMGEHWTWDIEEKLEDFVVFTPEEYRAHLSYSNGTGTWSDVEHNRFRRFILAVDPAQVNRAIARRQWALARERIRKVLWPF